MHPRDANVIDGSLGSVSHAAPTPPAPTGPNSRPLIVNSPSPAAGPGASATPSSTGKSYDVASAAGSVAGVREAGAPSTYSVHA